MVQLPAPDAKLSENTDVPTWSETGMVAGLFDTFGEVTLTFPEYWPGVRVEEFAVTPMEEGAVPEPGVTLSQGASSVAVQASTPVPAFVMATFCAGGFAVVDPKNDSDV